MPIYEYRCLRCEHVFEKMHSFSDRTETICVLCGGSVKRIFHPVGIVFKGSGFYVTDYQKTPPKENQGKNALKNEDKAIKAETSESVK